MNNSIWNPRRRVTIATVILAGALLPWNAVATTYAPTTIDRLLLEPTTIVLGSVIDISMLDSAFGVEVSLGDISCVSGDCDLEQLQFPLHHFDPALVAVRPFPHQPSLRIGGRYLLFLSGSGHRHTLISFHPSIYEVNGDGTLACPGGSIYGITAVGLYCSKAQYQFGQPLTESRLRALLILEQAAAQRRRPLFRRGNNGQDQQAPHTSGQGVRR